MIGTGKPIRIIVAWQTYSVGDRIDPPGTLRQWLIGSGYAEEVETPGRPAKLSRKAAAKLADQAPAAGSLV